MLGGLAREQGVAKLFGNFAGVDQIADDPAVRAVIHAQDQRKCLVQLGMFDGSGQQY